MMIIDRATSAYPWKPRSTQLFLDFDQVLGKEKTSVDEEIWRRRCANLMSSHARVCVCVCVCVCEIGRAHV